jgi:hypothetical protein
MNKEKPAGKLVSEKKVEAILQRLDRLTQDEALQSVAQTTEVVHGLVENVKVGGEQLHRSCRPLGVEYISL